MKKLEAAWGGMCGTSGYGLCMTLLHINPEVLKFTIAMITALCAGALGWAGQQGMKWIWYKIKKEYGKRTSNNDNNQ